MIHLSESAVLIKSGDGTSRAFEPEELQARLVGSCIASGVREFWLAEDLVNAVETALVAQSKEGVTFEAAEVDGIVAKALEEAGYPEVAEKFRSASGSADPTAPVAPDELRSLLSRRLGVSGTELESLAAAVMDACGRIGMAQPDQALLLELGRNLKRSPAGQVPPKLSLGLAKGGRRGDTHSPWLAVPPDLVAGLSTETRGHLDAGALVVGGISRLFPSIKIDLRLVDLATLLQLESPVTELALFPRLSGMAHAVDELVDAAREKVRSAGILCAGEDIPAYLRFADVPLFIKKCLVTDLAAGERFCAEAADCLVALLKNSLTVRGFRTEHRTSNTELSQGGAGP